MRAQAVVAATRIEPARLEEIDEESADLVTQLAIGAHDLGKGLHPSTLAQVAAMVRVMNSYYSNRIEGNNTRPRDIERALQGDFDADPAVRSRQHESAAHVRLQSEIDQLAARGELQDPSSEEFIKWLHREFYQGADQEALTIRRGDHAILMVPGEWRDDDVEVGEHVPPPHDKVPAFMAHYHRRFRQDWLHGQPAKILAFATGHHRLAYIHPFFDGNGRVSRLVSHAMAHHAGIAAAGLWSVSRGLARGLGQGLPGRDEYREMMKLADRPRQGDRDGRGNLSFAALKTYTHWFLNICIDQVAFMDTMLAFKTMGERLDRYAKLNEFRSGASELLRAVLIRGEVERGDVSAVTSLAPRTGRVLISDLTTDGILASDTPRGPLSLRFPAKTHETLFPRLFEA